MKRTIFTVISLLTGMAIMANAAPNLMVNGSFDHPEDPLKYWTIDYLPGNNQNYVNNIKHVRLMPMYGGKSNVLKVDVNEDKTGQDGAASWLGGTLVESPFIPFEQGCRYRFTLSIRGTKSGYHMYVSGCQWKPGVKPYENPNFFDLRARYRGPWFPDTIRKDTWTKTTCEFPDKKLSSLAIKNLKDVKLIALHIIQIGSPNCHFAELYIDDLVVEKLADGYTGGKVTADEKRIGE